MPSSSSSQQSQPDSQTPSATHSEGYRKLPIKHPGLDAAIFHATTIANNGIHWVLLSIRQNWRKNALRLIE